MGSLTPDTEQSSRDICRREKMTSRAPKAASKPHREPAPLLKAEDRKPSLKEMPSYLKEVSVALTRREDVLCQADPREGPYSQALAPVQVHLQQLDQGG